MKGLKACVVLVLICGLAACETKPKDTPDQGAPEAEATTPKTDAGAPSQPSTDMAKTEQRDAGSPDAGALDSGAPLKLKLDDTLFPATKSGPMPRLDIKPGQLNSPLGKPGKKNILPTK